ncbi:hypothetical protein JHK82_031327 [Glycine max]|nr:hypothetical protein JHK85_031979 [Glycine max]KAG5124590.1 hypothetical protein JHK82_031327 [Glycine max]
MEKLAKQVLFCSLLTALVLLPFPVIMSHLVEDESEFNYDVKSKRGPYNWGNIKPEWSICKNGSMQSPINLLNKRVQIAPHLGKLHINYQPSNATLRNRGHNIMLEWLAGTSYLQINETQFDLELHMVHEASSGEIAVIGMLYKAGRPDPLLSLLGNHIKAISDCTGAEIELGVLDPWLVSICRSRTQYYRYSGSLTTPPCTENVAWTVLTEVRYVSREQIRLLRVAVHDDSNARPLQPINNRLVKLYIPLQDSNRLVQR